MKENVELCLTKEIKTKENKELLLKYTHILYSSFECASARAVPTTHDGFNLSKYLFYK